MLRTATATDLRNQLSSHLEALKQGPLLVTLRGRPAAVLLEPESYRALVEKLELLLEVVEAPLAIDSYYQDASTVVDAEEAFERLGHRA
ncbi:MAG: type II toxin-antitoxin system Phd/YefM family antitoxin [Anaerolineales bacterium]